MLTLTTTSMDTRDDLPKVHYATALDWFVIMCFGFVIGSLLQFAAVHYFTKIGSGEFEQPAGTEDMGDLDEDDEWLDEGDWMEDDGPGQQSGLEEKRPREEDKSGRTRTPSGGDRSIRSTVRIL